MVRLHSLRERLRISLWLVPAVLAAGAGLLALALGWLDRRLASEAGDLFVGFGGSPEGARSVLSAIAQSMLTFTGLVFTVTMLVLQLASTQLSPRVMRTFLRDRGNQCVLGVFVATFVFTLLVLREVRTPVDGGDPFVPAVSVWLAFALLLASVAAFVWYIDHMAHAIRASTVLANWREAVQAIDRRYPARADDERHTAPLDAPGPPGIMLKSPVAGIVTTVDESRLLELTRDNRRLIALVPRVGDFVPEGAPLMYLWGPWDRQAADDVRSAIGVGGERTIEQDVAFGVRQLVDVAVRALSPGTNDPTTAVQALDRIHDLLRRLAVRAIPSGVQPPEGPARLVVPRAQWADFVRLGLEEIRLAGASQVQVIRRLHVVLDDLGSVVPAERQGPLEAERRALDGMDSGHQPSSATAASRERRRDQAHG